MKEIKIVNKSPYDYEPQEITFRHLRDKKIIISK